MTHLLRVVVGPDLRCRRFVPIASSATAVVPEPMNGSPDFGARTTSGSYLFEVKADRDLELENVQAKKAAAERWARRVTDEGN